MERALSRRIGRTDVSWPVFQSWRRVFFIQESVHHNGQTRGKTISFSAYADVSTLHQNF
jgi:hypothetical protein